MKSNNKSVLTINGGSSSIKFALFEVDGCLTPLFYGKIENIGSNHSSFSIIHCSTNQQDQIKIHVDTQEAAARFLMDWLENKERLVSLNAIGHRIVHGMDHSEPIQITSAILDELKVISSYDPEHLPGEISLIETFQKRYPTIPQIGCFDTAFHTSLPPVARLLSIPRRYYSLGLKRYGFHGLSYAYLMEELSRVAGVTPTKGKLILAHLGNGASMTAIKNGQSVDTSMGFTPSAGLPMGTRSGDLDPGVAWYLMQVDKLSPDQFNHLINHESGLLGISETSADMRELIKNKELDSRAAEAIAFFCYQTKKWLGSYAAVLGGLDILVFSGGIGENAPEIRNRICADLQFLGIEIDQKRNVNNEAIISAETSKVIVRVIKTNEEIMIARLVCQVLNFSITH